MEVKHETSEDKIESKESIKLVYVDNFDKICRTCLSDTIDLRSCFDIISDNMSAANLIEDYTSLLVASNDFLPQNICNVCIAALLNSHTFKLNCINNEKILSTKKVEINKIDENVLILQENDMLNDDYISEEIVFLHNDELSQELQIDTTTKLKSVRSRNIKRSSNSTKATKKLDVPSSLKCTDCDEKFESKDLFKAHMIQHSRGKNKECSVCNKAIKTSKMKQHMRGHTKEKPHTCKVCFQGFSMSGNLKRHMMTHTGERPHVCEYCGKGFIQATTLTTHRITHLNKERKSRSSSISATSTPNYICNYCGRGFKRIARYNAHLKRHLTGMDRAVVAKREANEEMAGEYSCDQCKRRYKAKNLLKAHQLTHGEKTFLCSDCGKGFFTKAALTSHLKVHTGEKPHTCTVCKKSFAHVASFENHMLIHTGYKPYNCDICAKAFTQLSHLKYHLRTHSGERPYNCSYCGKTFALKGNLTVHVRIHTGETPYSCPVCKKGFYDSSSMKKHRRGHGEMQNNSINPQAIDDNPVLCNNSNLNVPLIKTDNLACATVLS